MENKTNEFNELFDGYSNDRERIKKVTEKTKDMSVAEAFASEYKLNISKALKNNPSVNVVTVLELGKMYCGKVKEFGKDKLTFEIPGVKEDIICKENFNDCIDNINNYLLTHKNCMMFVVREKQQGKFIVSVIDAYYEIWKEEIMEAINHDYAINVHIDSLIKAGYLCHTEIFSINELTGRNYTSSVFIPGSHIVLNIERDFSQWIGADVMVIPQKFVKFKTAGRPVEDSLVGSRKRVLEIEGMKNMFEIYTRYKLGTKAEVKFTPETFEGTVTGIINSNKKTGVFIELDGKYITGLMNVDASDLLNYKPGDKIMVKIKSFEVQEGKEPFIVDKKRSVIQKSNVRVIFEQA